MPTYNGTPGNDSLLGSFGDDQLYGGAGDDTLDGSWGKDTLDGGDGIDTATYAFYNRGINVDLTTGVLGFPDYPGYFETLRNIENLIGSQGNDTLKGNAANNVLNGGFGDDQLYGGFGDDQLYGGAGDDTLDGSWGKDTLDGGDGIDTATYAFYDRGINVDLTTGVLGFPDYPGYFETLHNIENLIGSQGNDTLKGNAANNVLSGGLGNDELYGDAGNDSLNGGEGNDSLRGGDGDDLLFGDNPPFAQGLNLGDDTMFGGSGNDIMVGWGGNDLMEGDNGDDYLYGMDGNDTVLGGNGRDVVDGGAGNDVLFGGNNDDILSGSSVWGISSAFERDVLIAGGGADTFVLAEDTGADMIGVGRVVATYYLGDSYAVIADFNASEGDKIKLAGSMGDYSFKPTNVLGDSFPNVGIFKDDDLIAAVYNVTSLSESNFVFV